MSNKPGWNVAEDAILQAHVGWPDYDLAMAVSALGIIRTPGSVTARRKLLGIAKLPGDYRRTGSKLSQEANRQQDADRRAGWPCVPATYEAAERKHLRCHASCGQGHGMSVTIWDKIATLTPTRDAAVATSGGDTWEDGLGRVPNGYQFKAPPPIKRSTPRILEQQLIGRRVGRMFVLGVMEGTNSKKPAVWACRCDCGDYTAYTAKALKNVVDDFGCPACQRAKRIRFLGSKTNTTKVRAEAALALDALAGERGDHD